MERISRVSLPLSSLVLECCLRKPGDRIDAASALFRVDMYTLPVPSRAVAMDEESTAVEKCYDLVRVMGPVRRTHVKAVLAVMRDYSASLRVLEAGCKALAEVASATLENRDAVASTSAHITVISTMMLFRDIQVSSFDIVDICMRSKARICRACGTFVSCMPRLARARHFRACAAHIVLLTVVYFVEKQAQLQTSSYPTTAGYLSFGPIAQCVVHALKGLAQPRACHSG